MSTPEESSVYPEGVIDVSIIVPACFQNPLKGDSIAFVSDVLAQRRRVALPTTAVVGAYHIATTCLGVPRIAAKQVLGGILRTRSMALYPHVSPEMALDALDYASAYNVESWDGYLVALARSFRSSVVFSLDKDLKRVKEISFVNPFREDKVKEYHEFLGARI